MTEQDEVFSTRRQFVTGAICVAVMAGTGAVSLAQEGPQPVRLIVRAEGRKGAQAAPLQASDIKVEVDKTVVPVTRLQPLLSSTNGRGRTEVAVLIDDGLRGSIGVNLSDIDKFSRQLASPTTAVGIGYMRNGRAYFANGFSSDPEVVAKSLRLPIGNPGAASSPYFALQSLVKNWPTRGRANHVVLMITNGIDPWNGSVSPLNQNSPYVQQAVTDAQRANVPVYSIYFGNRPVNSRFGSFSGQSYLNQVAEGTGGVSYNQGTITPPSISPYLEQFTRALGESYTADISAPTKRLMRLKVSSNVPDVKVYAQQQIQGGTTGAR